MLILGLRRDSITRHTPILSFTNLISIFCLYCLISVLQTSFHPSAYDNCMDLRAKMQQRSQLHATEAARLQWEIASEDWKIRSACTQPQNLSFYYTNFVSIHSWKYQMIFRLYYRNSSHGIRIVPNNMPLGLNIQLRSVVR